ncbi:MAG TPA: 2-C-methyl-D-erythritol 2,4-cyclodiphosphate synthase, partial [Fibrobacteraceae bacterium]|nr:2-C-methyl-D-erythritol 2,4-cyclodiphosphate synthase [Fibrobacteraceae bacterium]
MDLQQVPRSGIGFDVHRLVEGRKCIIGGVTIPYEKGLLGHSDADVLVHAVCDALLGAMGLGDIGVWFPDNDPALKGIDSLILLDRVRKHMENGGFTLINVDAIVICERPKINPHRLEMIANLARVLRVNPGQIGVKATTSEKLGFPGRGEGIASQAVASLLGPL